MHFASMLFTHCLVDHSTPKRRLLMTLRKFILSREAGFRKFIDRWTLLRDICHAAGAKINMLLEIQALLLTDLSPEALASTISSEDSLDAAAANVVSNLILTECVARTLKAMILSRIASMDGGGVGASDGHTQSINGVSPRPSNATHPTAVASQTFSTSEDGVSLPQRVCDIATEVLRRFATSDIFF
jgi:hypothetical protein